MALDTIDKVREAELAADQAEKDASVEADRIVAKAEDDAIALKSSLSRESREKAEKAVSEAQTKGDALLADAKLEAEKSIAQLRSSVAAKEDDAVKVILEDLTN